MINALEFNMPDPDLLKPTQSLKSDAKGLKSETISQERKKNRTF